jgi:uncharacterized membrane-anchored protein YitT (DUF2179 family)
MTLYTDCVEAGLKIDHHGSDLYIKDGYKARELVIKNGKVTLMKEFVDNIDHEAWIEIPFAYDPWNEKR